MKIQNLEAVRERIRQLKLELAQLKMMERLALLERESYKPARPSAGQTIKGQSNGR